MRLAALALEAVGACTARGVFAPVDLRVCNLIRQQ